MKLVNKRGRLAARKSVSISGILLIALGIASFPNISPASGSPSVQAPASLVLAPSTADQDPGDFTLSNFGTGQLLVSVGFVNPPSGTTFKIMSTSGLTRSFGYSTWDNLTQISFVGTQSDANTALSSMLVSTGSARGNITIKVSATPNPSGVAFNPVNQNFYEYISSSSWASDLGLANTTKPTFDQAVSFAAARSFDGVSGYLVTITSSQENDFVKSNIQNALNIWIGASDSAVEGDWKWISGPETDTLFWRGVGNGTTQGGNYASWSNGEPNNASNEDAAVTNWNGPAGLWNDLSTTNTGSIGGLVVEYSAWNNQNFASLKSAQITAIVGVPPTGLTISAGNEQALASWIAPASGTVSSYTVTATATGKSPRSCTTAGTSCTVTRLENGVPYEFTVTATYSDSSTSSSLPASATPVNSAPTISGPSSATVQATVAGSLGTFSITDPYNCGWTEMQVTVSSTDTSVRLNANAAAGATVTGANTSELGIRGSKSSIESTLSNLTFTSSVEGTFVVSTVAVPSIRFTVAGNTYHFNPDNGHYYRVVSSQTTWQNAKTAASNLRYCGSAGYLVAIDNTAEQQFIRSEALTGSGDMWTSGYRDGATLSGSTYTGGTWKWLPGPNAGASDELAFYDQGSTPGQAPWHTSEPNGSGVYHQLWYKTAGSGSSGYGWDDVGDGARKYLVEFGSSSTFTSPMVLTNVSVTAAPASAPSNPGVSPSPTASPSPTPTTPTGPSNNSPRPQPRPNPAPVQDPALNPPAPLAGPVVLPANGGNGGGAIVQGEEVPLATISSSDQELSLTAGEVNLNINVPGGAGVVDGSGATPELEVKRDRAVALEGEGMLPGSTVQVWLPGSNKNTELGRITVDEDGRFSGNVSFASTSDGSPLPIGPQVIQLTGVDRDGNQTVINLNITIAQPDPAPELFRGQIVTPNPGLGNFEASNAGLPEQATLTAITDQKQALIEGNGWELSLQLSGEGSGITENADGVFMTLVRGEAATFGGNGFMPGTIASIWLFSDPTMLGEVTIAADGSFSGITGPLDEAIAAGEHTIQIQGVGSDGFIRSANLGVVVAEPAVAAAPFAFFDWLPLILLGLLIAAGVFFAIVARRRKRSDGSNVIQFPQAA